jgi:hypothetical protein
MIANKVDHRWKAEKAESGKWKAEVDGFYMYNNMRKCLKKVFSSWEQAAFSVF